MFRSEYFLEKLETFFNKIEQRRIDFLTKLDGRIKNSAKYLVITSILAVIFSTDPGKKYYNYIADGFDNFFNIYSESWQSWPKYIKFFTPSKILWWSFPSPLMVTVLIAIFLLSRCMILIGSYRNYNVKSLILRDFLKEIPKSKYFERNLLLLTEYNKSLLLPDFDIAEIETEESFGFVYKEKTVVFSELALFSKDKINKIKKPIFQGIIAACEMDELDLSKNYQLNLFYKIEEALKKISSDTQHKFENIYEEISSLDHNDPLDIKALSLAKILNKYAEKINYYDLHYEHNYLDDKIFNYFKKLKPISSQEMCNKSIQISIKNRYVYFLIPFSRPLFTIYSIFNNINFEKEVELLSESLNLIKEVIDYIDSDEEY